MPAVSVTVAYVDMHSRVSDSCTSILIHWPMPELVLPPPAIDYKKSVDDKKIEAVSEEIQAISIKLDCEKHDRYARIALLECQREKEKQLTRLLSCSD
jgi:hypothetical protein